MRAEIRKVADALIESEEWLNAQGVLEGILMLEEKDSAPYRRALRYRCCGARCMVHTIELALCSLCGTQCGHTPESLHCATFHRHLHERVCECALIPLAMCPLWLFWLPLVFSALVLFMVF